MERVEAARAELGGEGGDAAERKLADAVLALEPRVGELSAREAYALYRAAGALADAGDEAGDPLALRELAARAVADVPGLVRSAGRAERDLAVLLYERGRREDALARLEDARARLREPPEVWADLALLHAQYLRTARRWREALDELAEIRETLARAGPAGDGALAEYRRVLSATALVETGEVWREWGLLDLAERRLAELREELAELPESSYARFPAEHFEANLLLARERTAELEALVRGLVDEPRYAGHSGLRGRLLVRLGVGASEAARADPSFAARAEAALAEALADEGLAADERGKARLALAELALRGARYAEAERELELAGEGLETSDRAHRAALAFALGLERGSGREELLALRAELERAFGAFLADWRDVPLRPGGFGFLQYRVPRRVLSELIRAELALHGEREGARRALEHVLAAQALHSLARSLAADASAAGVGASTLGELRTTLLGDRHALWVLLPAPERTHLFLVEGSGPEESAVRHVELAPRDAFEARRAELARRLAETPARAERESHVARVDEAARALAELVLAPPVAAGLAEWQRVTVVGADLFGGLPLEALPVPGGHTLGETVALAHLASVPLGIALASRSDPARTRGADEVWLVVAFEASGYAGLEGLALGEPEARRLARHHARTRIFINAAARAGVLSDPALAGAAVLHVFAHGVADAESERPPALLFSGEHGPRLLTCDDVDALSPPPLVVLSACATGAGPERRGDGGAADLGGAFLRAGARAVVLSPYRLELHATLALMEAFHAELDHGHSPAEALRRARRRFADSPRAWTFTHAMVQAIGLAHEPVLAPRTPALAPYTSPAVILLALAALAGLQGSRWHGARRRTATG